MLQHIVDNLQEAGVTDIFVVIGHESQLVRATIKGKITWVEQLEQLGTGHALIQAAEHLKDYPGDVLVLSGDVPLLTAATITDLFEEHRLSNSSATILTANVPVPIGYGRIVRAVDGGVTAIVEEKDTNQEQKSITEINSGTYCFEWSIVGPLLPQLGKSNAQGEYLLTDIIAMLNRMGKKRGALLATDYREVSGVNDRVQLAWIEKVMRIRIAEKVMRSGVTITDPESTYIDADVVIGQDTTVLPNTHILQGSTIGSNCVIGPDTTIISSFLAEGITVRHSVVEQAGIGKYSTVGPFAYIRPGAEIGDNVRIGDFVEIKNSRIGNGSKVPHLSYVGDAKVGTNSNIGCGVITANYDGSQKNLTEIGDGVFIGSNANLVAPVKVEDGAYVAAGSTITDNVPAGALAIARNRQTIKPDWRKK
jgi:bifunctional UDP-N-acetylglucosamine pyrophosphorylase/glucosamine-1-phosphate N-acetyltransferase